METVLYHDIRKSYEIKKVYAYLKGKRLIIITLLSTIKQKKMKKIKVFNTVSEVVNYILSDNDYRDVMFQGYVIPVKGDYIEYPDFTFCIDKYRDIYVKKNEERKEFKLQVIEEHNIPGCIKTMTLPEEYLYEVLRYLRTLTKISYKANL